MAGLNCVRDVPQNDISLLAKEHLRLMRKFYQNYVKEVTKVTKVHREYNRRRVQAVAG